MASANILIGPRIQPALSREGVSTRAMARQDNISATADYAEEFDVVVLQETWLKENPFERLLRDWRWETIASRDPLGTRGRNRGGFIFGWRRNVPSRNIRSSLEGNSEWVSVELLVNGRWIQVVGLYRHASTRFEDLNIPFNRDLPILLVGDMNARTADREASPAPSQEGRRRSRDMSLTSDREFLGFLRENGLEILNGTVDGDREGEFTHRHGSNVQSTIDYATANEAMRQQVRELKVDQTRRESDHFPLMVSLGVVTGKGKETDIRNQRPKMTKDEFSDLLQQISLAIRDLVGFEPDPKSLANEEELAALFCELMHGSTEENGQSQRQREESEERVTEAEIDRIIKGLSKRKAAGSDGITAESLIEGPEVLVKLITETINTRSFPISQKERSDDPAMSNVIAKVWAQVILDRLQGEVDEKKILPESQAGFRRGRGPLDNIYILDAVVNERIRRGSNTFVTFIDLKAAIDTVDQELLWDTLKRRGVSEYIINWCKDLYKVTPIQLGNHSFFTTMGVNQGCPLSRLLSAIYLSDIDLTMQGAEAGGVVMECGKLYTLAYADDMALLAENPNDMREMNRVLEGYLDRKKLELNVGKTKVLRFSNGGRLTKESWKWKEQKLKELKTFKYLGYTFTSNGKPYSHVKAVKEEAMRKLEEVQGIGERRFPNHFALRMQMFDCLIGNGILYGAEIYGWSQREELELVQRKYIKSILGLKPSTNNSVLYMETGRMPLHPKMCLRALLYEERIKESPNPFLKEALQFQRDRADRRVVIDGAGWNREEEL